MRRSVWGAAVKSREAQERRAEAGWVNTSVPRWKASKAVSRYVVTKVAGQDQRLIYWLPPVMNNEQRRGWSPAYLMTLPAGCSSPGSVGALLIL